MVEKLAGWTNLIGHVTIISRRDMIWSRDIEFACFYILISWYGTLWYFESQWGCDTCDSIVWERNSIIIAFCFISVVGGISRERHDPTHRIWWGWHWMCGKFGGGCRFCIWFEYIIEIDGIEIVWFWTNLEYNNKMVKWDLELTTRYLFLICKPNRYNSVEYTLSKGTHILLVVVIAQKWGTKFKTIFKYKKKTNTNNIRNLLVFMGSIKLSLHL